MASVHYCSIVSGVSYVLCVFVFVCAFVHVFACVVCDLLCGAVWFVFVCDVLLRLFQF